MAEIADEQRCKRSDGKGWRCRLPVAEGKTYCELHYQQRIRRQRKQPVPDHLKLERSKRSKQQDSVSSQPIEIGASSVPIRSNDDESDPNAEPVLYDLEEDAIRCDPEDEMTVLHCEKMSDFDQSQQLYMIQELLPVMTKMNQEKITELDTEVKTKDLEESATQILSTFQLKRLNRLSNSSPCLLCNDNVEAGLSIATKLEFKDNNLEHFMKHWGKGQPIVVRDVFQSQPDLDWDIGFILCEYLDKSAESQNNSETQSAKGTRDWCEIEFRRKQTFSGGATHLNAWNEFLKFKLRFSSDFFQDHFPDHFNAVIQSLPVQEYMNPFTGFLNLGAYSPNQTKNPNLGSYVSIYYGGLDNPMDADLFSNLRVHACDMVNILAHTRGHPIHERELNEVKMSIYKYNSRCSDMDLTSSRLEDTSIHEMVLVSDESESESDDEEVSQDADSCGACWDIFHREDVPMLLEYLRKYSDKLSRSHGSPKKVVHPLFDEVFYLDDDHKMRLKEEFNVDALSFKQHVGEAVIIPAGCPFQMKKIKSCVNVVYEFMSPESALEAIKVSDEIRRLPEYHKAKGNMVQVKKMVINRMKAAIEEMCEVSVSQTERYWPFVISHSATPPLWYSIKGYVSQVSF